MKYPTKKLGEICEIITGGTPKTSIKDFYGDEFLWAGPSDLDQGVFVVDTNKKLSKKGFRESGIRIIPKDSVMMSCIGYIGKIGIAQDEMATNQQINTFVPNHEILDSKYLYYSLISKTKEFRAGSSQTTLPIINKTKCANIEISLPPVGEQKKIVAKIEKQFAKIDGVARLRAESEAATAALLPAALHEIFSQSESKEWGEKTIEELALEIKSGFACSKSNEISDGVVHLRTHNVDLSGELNLDKIVRIPEKFVDTEVFTLRRGDVIFNNTNSRELVGKTIVIRDDLPYAFSNHLTRIRLNTSIVIPEWILQIFQLYWRDKVFEKMCTKWIGQAGINQTALKKIKIPLPPLAEQKKIVKKLDALSEKVRALQELQSAQAADLKALKQSILHEAFAGEQ